MTNPQGPTRKDHPAMSTGADEFVLDEGRKVVQWSFPIFCF
jgi:hypothetical protein